jgi:hypothetical protein
MAYPEKGAKYAGEDRAAKLCRADGGAVEKSVDRARTHLRNMTNFDAGMKQKGLGTYSPTQLDMNNATRISDAVPRRKE